MCVTNFPYGHAAGDAVLAQIGRLLRDSVRESDVVGRLGDEFGVILNRAAADEARAKSRALRELLYATPIPHAGVLPTFGAIAPHLRVGAGEEIAATLPVRERQGGAWSDAGKAPKPAPPRSVAAIAVR